MITIIDGFPGYLIDSSGNITGLKGKLMSPFWRGSRGGSYPSVTLIRKDGRTNKMIHRLVAETFLPRIPGKNIVNHIDKDRSNYHLDNLEWVT